MGAVDQLIDASRRLCDDLIQRTDDLLADQGKVAWIYHPLEYARAPHEAYLTRFGGLGAHPDDRDEPWAWDGEHRCPVRMSGTGP